MKKIMCTLIAVVIINISCVPPAFALENDQKTQEKFAFDTVIIDNETITVPTITRSVKKPIATRSGSLTCYKDSVTYYLPVTEEAQAYNEELVRNSGELTQTKPEFDPQGYMIATSHITYVISEGTIDGQSASDLYILITNVALTKDKDPESIVHGGYLLGISNPVATKIICTGARPTDDFIPGTFDQEVYNVTMNWSETGISTPSSWVPVISDKYSDMFDGYASYSYSLIYDKIGTVSCTISHEIHT
ncbi:hypothetical protein [uncultured Flavonifractor sp.]|uniref:hypothetical protein n=1 Tax=uncultured Flavonifractor sp. TaxID=1193534 RepID=UPI002637B360|nr:hypothetical protein [uncultured Flavonifractor sp.]